MAIDAASHLRSVILRLKCRENMWLREPATGAAAGRARRRRAPRRTTNSSPGNSRGRAAAFLQSTRSPRPWHTTGPRRPLPGETSAARCGDKSAITVSATGGGPADIGRRPCSRSASPGTARRSPRRSAPAAPVLTETLANAISENGAAPREGLLESMNMLTENSQRLRRVLGASHPATKRNAHNLKCVQGSLARLE